MSNEQTETIESRCQLTDLEVGAETDLKTQLARLERRDWTLWTTAVVVLLLVCVAIVTARTLPIVMNESDIIYTEQIDAALRSLVGILLIFSTFVVYQQLTIKRLRKRMIWQIEVMTALKTRADLYAKLAVLDPLTELFNRRFANEHLPREIARAERQGYPLTLLALDLNEFKTLNDQYGHAIGDHALRTFARALKRAIRNSDIAIRTGGDEFMVILPECQMCSVPAALARLRHESVTIGDEKEVPITFAAGWAELQFGDTAEDLVARADRALYADKRSGASQAQAQQVAADNERGEKLQIVGQLTGQVAHDFKNLLAIIKGYSAMALHGLDANEPAREKVAQIAKAAEQATHLTSQLLAFTRANSQQMTLIDVNERAHDVVALLAPLLSKEITLAVSAEATEKMSAQAGHLEQILVNLVTNARDALPNGGAIAVSTRDQVLDQDFAQSHPGSRAGRYVAVTVTDNGIGMDEATRARVFYPYFTTKPNGTGIGLSTVFGIIKQMGGYIDVQSKPNQGATFTAYLPVHKEHADPGKFPDMRIQVGEKLTVLVVEGLDALRDMIHEVLTSSGCNVLAADSAEQALEFAARSEYRIDISVCDVLLTGMSCRELTQELTRRYPEMNTLFLAGDVSDPIWSAGLMQMGEVLGTPFSPDELVKKVRALHARSRAIAKTSA